jgi:hypothetical protein
MSTSRPPYNRIHASCRRTPFQLSAVSSRPGCWIVHVSVPKLEKLPEPKNLAALKVEVQRPVRAVRRGRPALAAGLPSGGEGLRRLRDASRAGLLAGGSVGVRNVG